MRYWSSFCFSFLSIVSFAQNEEIDLEQFAESLFQAQEEPAIFEDLYESLLQHYTNKLSLNSATEEELEELFIMTQIQINSFLKYRNDHGPILSILELQSIPALDLNTIRLLLPFVTVKKDHDSQDLLLRRIVNEKNNYFLLRYSRRIEKQKGYSPGIPLDTTYLRNEDGSIVDTLTKTPDRYLGSPAKIYGRFRTSRKNDFSIGFTFEKDAGESFSFHQRKHGFDFYSYHLLLEKKLGFEKIILGDYRIQTGQGLVFGTGFSTGKGGESVFAIKRNTIGFRPYTSVLEHGFFRGIGMTKKLGKFELSGFYSNLRRDGNIKSDSLEFSAIFSESQTQLEEFANSIAITGLHRTKRELDRRKTIREESIGWTIRYSPLRTLKLGVNALQTRFSIPLGKTPNNRNQFEFKGMSNRIGSIFGNYTWQNLTFFGEVSKSQSGGLASIGGFLASLSSKVDLAFLIRNYARNFHTFYGNAFAESSKNINEKGHYLGLSITPKRNHQLNVFYDRFDFPWMRFLADAPSKGNEWLIKYAHRPSKNVDWYVQLRNKTREVSSPNGNLNVLVDQVRTNYRFNLQYQAMSQLTLRTKVQGSIQKKSAGTTRGFAIIQDLNFSFRKLKFHTRIALFETEDFSNAQYVYENDVLFSFSVPPYNGVGLRNYVMVRYEPFPATSFWVRYSRTSFADLSGSATRSSSSLEASDGNVVSDIKMMLRHKF